MLRRRVEELENGNQAGHRSTEESLPCSEQQSQSEEHRQEEAPKVNAMMGMADEGLQEKGNAVWDSSANGFIRQIKSIIASQSGTQNPPQDTSSDSGLSPLERNSRSTKGQTFNPSRSLPSRKQADQLLEIFWHLKATMFPILDKEDFIVKYEQLWSGQPMGEDGQIFICMINIMFSIATVLDPTQSFKGRLARADAFYQRAQRSLDFKLLQSRSLLTVQFFLLLGSYLQSTKDSQQCWIYVGLAIRVAQSLGLDRASTSANATTVRMRETLRRVWHGCVYLDRVLSLTFGRQPLISFDSENEVPLPESHFHDQCDCFNTLTDDEPDEHEFHFFVESLKYYALISRTLLTLYNSPAQVDASDDPYSIYFGTGGPKTVGYLAEIDQKLRLWRRALPCQLQHCPGAPKSKVYQRQSNALWLRDHYIRILMLRPILSRFCSQAEVTDVSLQDVMPSQLAFQFSVMCIKTALEVIDFLHTTIQITTEDGLEDIIPAWWYSILYTYTAASVIVVARVNAAIIDTVSETAILQACRNVIQVLKRFETYGEQAATYSTSVEVLFSQIRSPAQRSDHSRQPIQSSYSLGPHSAASSPVAQGFDQRNNSLAPVDPQISARADTAPNTWWNNGETGGYLRQGVQGTLRGPGHDYGILQQMGTILPPSPGTFHFTDTSNLWVDLCDMSWLNNAPFQ